MQMLQRLLLFLLVLGLYGCAQLPADSLHNVQTVIAKAYAIGADRHSPGEYQLARRALQTAESQVETGDYRKAAKTLELAQRYADEALNLSLAKNKIEKAETKKRAQEQEDKRLKEQQEINRQAQLKKERERIAQIKKTKSQIKNSVIVAVEPRLVDQIAVLAGDDLAVIAARREVYNDRMLWPLIYRANRDQIKNPEEIFTGQTLKIPRDKSDLEIIDARKEALELGLFMSLE